MATSTKTFAGITKPSTTHKATYGTGSSLPTPPSGTEGEDANYTSLTTGDDNKWDTGAAFAGGIFPYKIYRWYVTETGITQYTAGAEGWGLQDIGPEYYYGLYIWNFITNGGQWELLNSHAGSSDATITGNITTNLANYISAGYVYTATIGPAIQQWESGELHDDYVYLTVTYTLPAATGNFFLLFK